jgi:UDP-N-acetylglucosamine 4-epimerase
LNVLVTGGAGFIGSNIVRTLLARGDSVRVLDDFSSGKRHNLEGLERSIEVVEGDIRDPARCREACSGVDAVLHQAAVGSVPRSIEDPLTTHQVNVDGTLNMLLAARAEKVRRFVFASSSSVYGDAPEPVKVETLPARPISPYAVTKLAGEQYVIVFSKVYGMEGVALRYFNVFGPHQDPESMYAAVVPRFAAALLEGRPPTINGDGEQTRDFTYVDNVVRANLLALECPLEACGKAYNVACGGSTSVNALFRAMRERLRGESARMKPVHAPAQKGDVRDSLASIDAARKGLGYMPTTGVEEGIRLTCDWYKANLDALKKTAVNARG